MKLRLFKAGLLLLVTLLLSTQPDGFSQVKKRKSKIGVGRPLEEWNPEPDSEFYKLVTALPKVDKAELYFYHGKRLDNLPRGSEIPALILQFGMPVDVISSKILSDKDAEAFASIWRKVLRGNGAGCIVPAYRIRFYTKDKLILEADVCFHCHNLALKRDTEGNSQIWGFNADSKSGQALLAKLKELLPEKTDKP